MNMILQPATPAERLYIYEQSMRIAERCGNPGYLWGELDNTGSIFLHSWEDIIGSQNTPEFKAEFNTVLDNAHDVLEMSGSRAVWPEVLAVYAVKTATDPDDPQEVGYHGRCQKGAAQRDFLGNERGKPFHQHGIPRCCHRNR